MMDIENFYNNVINDVIEGMKETFTQEGCDLDVLEQLRNLWSSKLAETHVTDPEPLSQPIIQFAQRIKPSQFPGVFHYQTVIGQQSMGIPIARLPIQPNVGGIHTLQPIGRPNAPLTTLSMGTGGPATGLVLRSSLSEPMSGAPRPIMLTAALNPQNAQGVQQRIGNPNGQFTGITIRTQTSNTGQPGQATIIGQPMNGVIQGQNVQFVQLGQPTLMLPLQLRQSAPAQQGTTSTTTTTATILPAPPHHHHQQTIQQQQHQQTQQMHIQMQAQNQHQQHFQQQQIQQIQIQQQRMHQQQNFNRASIITSYTLAITQVDGAGDGDSDFSDEDADVLEPYSVETPLRTGLLSVAPASTPRLGGGGNGVRSKQPSFNYLQQPPSSALGVLEDDDDTDDEGMVAATPGAFALPTGTSSSFTPNPTPIPATPTPKRPTSPPNQATETGAGVTKRSRGEDTLVEEDVDIDSEEGEGDFGSVTTMTPPAHQTTTLTTLGTATPTTSRRKQKAPKGNQQQKVSDHTNILDLPPPEKPKVVSEKKEQEGVTDGTTVSGDGSGGDKNDIKGGPKEQDDDEEEEEEEDEPLNSGDDVSDEDAEELFQSENLVVCQYDRVSRCRSKWRFWLHDGVMKIRGRDRLFHKMIVETDWLVDASFRP